MNARFYVGSIGRFASADTIVSNPANPQSLNRYSYGYNNPVKYNDPSGHEPCISENWGDCNPDLNPLPPLDHLPNNWPDPSSVEFRDSVFSAANEMGIPPQILYGVIYTEMLLDTDGMDGFENVVLSFRGLGWAATQIRKNPGPGVGNIHIASAREVSDYFDANYPNIDLGFSSSDKTHVIARFLTDPSNSVRVSAAYVRMMADHRFGDGGVPSIQSHSNLSNWSLEDGLAMWHSFRYGVNGVNNGGQGFESITEFQNRSVPVNLLVNQAGGIGAADSISGAIPIFEALGVESKPVPWGPQ